MKYGAKWTVVLALIFAVLLGGTAFELACAKATKSNESVKIHYIDVGQADSILIQSGGQNVLIDAGNKGDSKLLLAYLKKQGVKRLDYLIGTHPHEDHIGAMSSVVKEFQVKAIMMPKATSNTKTFENLLVAIKEKGLKITAPVSGESFNAGDARFTILAPNSKSYDDLNNFSIVLKLQVGKTAFLFQGDAERKSELEILAKGQDLKADVIKLGHHGSGSSSSAEYLDKVKPKYAVISCERNNDYGHPHKETLSKLSKRRIKVYRTDINGTIVATTDGSTIKFKTGR